MTKFYGVVFTIRSIAVRVCGLQQLTAMINYYSVIITFKLLSFTCLKS